MNKSGNKDDKVLDTGIVGQVDLLLLIILIYNMYFVHLHAYFPIYTNNGPQTDSLDHTTTMSSRGTGRFIVINLLNHFRS